MGGLVDSVIGIVNGAVAGIVPQILAFLSSLGV